VCSLSDISPPCIMKQCCLSTEITAFEHNRPLHGTETTEWTSRAVRFIVARLRTYALGSSRGDAHQALTAWCSVLENGWFLQQPKASPSPAKLLLLLPGELQKAPEVARRCDMLQVLTQAGGSSEAFSSTKTFHF